MKQPNNLLSVFSAKPLMLLFFFTLLPTMANAQCPDNNHPHMIDLGLPSGTKWACCNVGAQKPEDYGGYYAWGETEEKSTYNWTTYIHCDGSMQSCHYLGADIAGTNYDVAHVTWGSSWVMPNQEQINELVDNCQNEIAIENGIPGRMFTGPNGRTIFLPAAGENWNGELSYIGKKGHYYSSNSEAINCANLLTFYVDNNTVVGDDEGYRAVGWSVRPVAVPSTLSDNIDFADSVVKSLCIQNWDTNGDQELSYAEAAAVTDLGEVFKNTEITNFNELQYFTGLTSLDSRTFFHCYNLTSVIIPNCITAIGDVAFGYCYKLTTINIPNSVSIIGNNPFISCNSLSSIDLEPENQFYVSEDGVLFNKDKTTIIGYPCGNTNNHYAIPNSVTRIGDLAFFGSSNLTEVIIPEGVTIIGNESFRECYSLVNLTIPNGVTDIGSAAFYGCSNLSSLTTIPDNVEYIFGAAFMGCRSLTSIKIGKSVSFIGADAFRGCESLTSINVDKDNTEFDSREDCNAIIRTNDNELIVGCMNTIIPNSVTTIGHTAFHSCTGLMSLAIPNSVTTIKGYAFAFCDGLTNVTIPNSVTDIYEGAFYGCTNLAEVRCMISDPFEIGSDCWESVNTDKIPLYVPAGCKEKYEATEGWNVFKNIVEMGIEPVDQGETIDIGNEIDENTDLDGNVVGDVYYCISSGDGSYDPEEGCIVVTKPTDDSAIDGKDIFGEDFKAGYTGFVFMVAPGKGTIKVEAETTGNMVLKVKVGDNAPTQMEVDGKTKVSFAYDVSEPTLVYIYGSIGAAGAKGMMKAPGTDMLKIYGIEMTSTNGIEAIDNGQLTIDNSPVYNLNGQRVESSKFKVQNSKLPKGIYIQNGKKVLVK